MEQKKIIRARTRDVAFTYRMPAGIPGTITRASSAHVEGAILDATNPPTAYGVPMVIDATSHNARKVIAGDVAATVYGLYVRAYPVEPAVNDPLGTSTPPTTGIVSVLKRGYMVVKLNNSTAAAKDGLIYIRTVTGTGTIIGGIEAAADSTNTFVLPSNFYFMGPADSNGNVEVAWNI